jgi:hypothetical protein
MGTLCVATTNCRRTRVRNLDMDTMTNSSGKIELAYRKELNEAKNTADDWTGKTDAKERRKLQNRLHQRAWRGWLIASPSLIDC